MIVLDEAGDDQRKTATFNIAPLDEDESSDDHAASKTGPAVTASDDDYGTAASKRVSFKVKKKSKEKQKERLGAIGEDVYGMGLALDAKRRLTLQNTITFPFVQSEVSRFVFSIGLK